MTIRPYTVCYLNTDDDMSIFMYMYRRLLSKYNRQQLHDMLDEIIDEYGGLFSRSIAMFALFQDEYPDENE